MNRDLLTRVRNQTKTLDDLDTTSSSHYLSIYLFIHLFIFNLFIYFFNLFLFIYFFNLFVYLLIHLFIYVFIYIFIYITPIKPCKTIINYPDTSLSLRNFGFNGKNPGSTRRPSLHISSQLQRNDLAKHLLRPKGEIGPVGSGQGWCWHMSAAGCDVFIVLCGVMCVYLGNWRAT
jgi:hypothetical protein